MKEKTEKINEQGITEVSPSVYVTGMPDKEGSMRDRRNNSIRITGEKCKSPNVMKVIMHRSKISRNSKHENIDKYYFQGTSYSNYLKLVIEECAAATEKRHIAYIMKLRLTADLSENSVSQASE